MSYKKNMERYCTGAITFYKGKLKKYVTAHANATVEVDPTHHADEINALIHKQIQKHIVLIKLRLMCLCLRSIHSYGRS